MVIDLLMLTQMVEEYRAREAKEREPRVSEEREGTITRVHVLHPAY